MRVCVLPACKSAQHMTHNHLCPQRPEEGAGSPGARVTDSCEPPCGGWELNPGPLEEQPVFLTTEPSPRESLRFY